LEKQEFKTALEYMAAGVTPLGNALKAGAVPFQQVFGANGIFQQNWPTSTFTTEAFTHTWQGNINDFFTGILGRTSDAGLNNRFLENLQVCDRDFNVYKEYMVKGADFISNNLWSGHSRTERVGILLDVVDMHSYRSVAEVVKSYASSFEHIAIMFDDLKRFAATQGINYDFRSAWEQIMPDYLDWQINRIRLTFGAYLDPEIVYWGTAAAKKLNTPTVVAKMAAQLADLKTNTNTYLSLPISKMTA
jgi:hypothetical protein